MTNEVRTLPDQYFHWLKNNTILRGLGDAWTEITTPFLDRHNDCLQIYVRSENDGYRLTDDGYILSDLRMCGCDLDSPKRQAMFREMLSGFGIQVVENRLETLASRAEFSQRKHNLIQAMLSVNDMFYLSSPHTTNLFLDTATNWLDSQKIRYTPNVQLKGKSGFSYHFHAVIPKSDKEPERILQAINNPDRTSVQHLIFEWNDTKEERSQGSTLYPLLNDEDKSVRPELITALAQYGITCILWKKRDKFITRLSV